MTQHITQEQAVELSIRSGDEFAIHEAEFYTSLCNAAIQHYMDQHKAELPVLPDLTLMWADINAWYESKTPYPKPTAAINETVIAMLQAYGQKCAAHAREMALEEAIQAIRALWHGDGDGERKCIYAIEALKGK